GRVLERYRRERLTAVTWGGVFFDPSRDGARPLAHRPAGCELRRRLRPGGHVVLPALDRAFRRARDAADTLAPWREQGVVAHLLDLRAALEPPRGARLVQLAARLADCERAGRAQRAFAALARRRQAGKASNQYVGYGFKLAGRRGRRRAVPDPQERAV